MRYENYMSSSGKVKRWENSGGSKATSKASDPVDEEAAIFSFGKEFRSGESGVFVVRKHSFHGIFVN